MKPTYERRGIRMYLGDSREVLPSLEAGTVDFVFTDPPYGHNNNDGDFISKWENALGRGKPNEARPINNDGPEANDLFRFVLGEFNRLLSPGCCCCCCCGGGGPDPQFARWSTWMDEVIGFKHLVVWDKGPMGMGWHYRRSYETIIVGQKPGAACRWFDTSDRIENVIRNVPKIIPQADQHPTVKPVALSSLFIRLHSQEGQTVLDPFMGSGSTGVSCVRLGRNFIGVESDPQWFDLAVKRVEESFDQGSLLDGLNVSRETQEFMFEVAGAKRDD